MKKLAKRSFKGIDYIRLSSLTAKQAEKLRRVLSTRSLIKIQMQDNIIDDCVLYDAYEDWFSTYIDEPVSQPIIASTKKSVSLT